MPYPSVTFAQLLENTTRAELEQFAALLQGYLSQQHKDNGAHGVISVDGVSSSLVPQTNGTYDLGQQTATGSQPFLAWRDLFLTRTLSWCGSALSLASLHIASWTDTLSGHNRVSQANVATTQTHTFKSSTGTTLATIGGSASIGGSVAVDSVTIPTLATTVTYAATRVATPTVAANGGTTVQQYDVRTVASAATYDFPNGATARGFLFITAEEDNATAIFMMRAGSGTTSLVSDPVGLFSATSGAAGTTNVYWNGGSGSYRIQNNRGASRTYELVLVGTGII